MRQKNINQIESKYLRKIAQTNESNKITKNCCLSRYKRLSSNKINYMFVPRKSKTKEQ